MTQRNATTKRQHLHAPLQFKQKKISKFFGVFRGNRVHLNIFVQTCKTTVNVCEPDHQNSLQPKMSLAERQPIVFIWLMFVFIIQPAFSVHFIRVIVNWKYFHNLIRGNVHKQNYRAFTQNASVYFIHCCLWNGCCERSRLLNFEIFSISCFQIHSIEIKLCE